MDVTHCIYHDNCYDGFGSALAIWKRWPHAVFIPMKWGQEFPILPKGSRVVVCDFSFPRSLLLKARETCEVIIIDHHKTAEEQLRGVPDVIFDMTHSGAYLTWVWAHPVREVPPMIKYIEDRDLWKFELHKSREFSASLQSFPYDFQTWNAILEDGDFRIGMMCQEGDGILRAKEQMVTQMAKNAVFMDLGGHNVPVANAACYFSEVAEELCELHPTAPFGAYYMDRKDGKRQWGMRSKGDFDVSEVAKKYGGGGHKSAAGFETSVPKIL